MYFLKVTPDRANALMSLTRILKPNSLSGQEWRADCLLFFSQQQTLIVRMGILSIFFFLLFPITELFGVYFCKKHKHLIMYFAEHIHRGESKKRKFFISQNSCIVCGYFNVMTNPISDYSKISTFRTKNPYRLRITKANDKMISRASWLKFRSPKSFTHAIPMRLRGYENLGHQNKHDMQKDSQILNDPYHHMAHYLSETLTIYRADRSEFGLYCSKKISSFLIVWFSSGIVWLMNESAIHILTFFTCTILQDSFHFLTQLLYSAKLGSSFVLSSEIVSIPSKSLFSLLTIGVSFPELLDMPFRPFSGAIRLVLMVIHSFGTFINPVLFFGDSIYLENIWNQIPPYTRLIGDWSTFIALSVVDRAKMVRKTKKKSKRSWKIFLAHRVKNFISLSLITFTLRLYVSLPNPSLINPPCFNQGGEWLSLFLYLSLIWKTPIHI